MRLRHPFAGRVFGSGLGLTLILAGAAGAGPARAPLPPERPAALASTLAGAPAPRPAAEPALRADALRAPAIRPARSGPFAGLEALRRDPPAFSPRFAARADPVAVRPEAAPAEAPAESSGTLARSAPRFEGPRPGQTFVGQTFAGAPLAGAWREGVEALGAGRYADAVERFRNLAEQRPDLVRPRLALARALALEGDCTGARAALAGAASGSRLAPRLAAEVEGDVARRCADAADWTAALAMRFGLPDQDVRLPGALPDLGFGRAQVSMAPAEAAWADVGVALTDAARLTPGVRMDLSGRGAVQFADRTPARVLAEAALVAAADDPLGAAHRAGFDASLDLGPDAQGLSGRVWARYQPRGAGAAWAELSTGLAARHDPAVADEARMELRAITGAGLGRAWGGRFEMQAEMGHAAPAGGVGDRQAWAGLALRREAAAEMGGGGPSARGRATRHGALAVRSEIFATLDAARASGGGWRPASVRAGARLVGVSSAGGGAVGASAAGLELALIRELGDVDGAALELALTQGF